MKYSRNSLKNRKPGGNPEPMKDMRMPYSYLRNISMNMALNIWIEKLKNVMKNSMKRAGSFVRYLAPI